MNPLVHFATRLPFAVALVVVTVTAIAVLSRYPGSININWRVDGGSFRIDGAPATDVQTLDIELSKPEAGEH